MARSIALTMALVAGCTSTIDATPAPSTTVAPPAPEPSPTQAPPMSTTVATTTTTRPPRASRRQPRPPAPTEGMPGQDVTLACIRHWESRNNYRAVSRSGRYRGAYQFDQATYEANGGTGDPAEASVEEQDAAAATLLSRRGLQPWPTPARRCA